MRARAPGRRQLSQPPPPPLTLAITPTINSDQAASLSRVFVLPHKIAVIYRVIVSLDALRTVNLRQG